MLRQGIGGFMAGGGFGGGFGGQIAGAALGMLSPMQAFGTLAGLGVAYGRQKYSDHVQQLVAFEQLGRLTGNNPDQMLLQSAGDTSRFRVFDPQAVTQVTQMLGRMTGDTDPNGPLATGAVTGTDPAQEAMRVAQAAQFMPHLGEAREMSLDTLAEFRRSGATRSQASLAGNIPTVDRFSAAELAQKRQEVEVLEKVLASDSGDYPGRANYERLLEQRRREVAEGGDRRVRGPDFDPLLYTTFADTALRSYAGLNSNPFIPTSKTGVDAQLSAATRIPMPGIDPQSHAGVHAAGALMEALNSFTQPRGDVFGDMQMAGVMRLRGTETAEKLKAMGIDISNPLGVMRAMQRAPQLARAGHPEVQQSMFDSVREMMPDADMRGLALTMSGGLDPETAYQLSRPEVGQLIGAQPPPPGAREADRERLNEAALVTTQGSLASAAADKIYQENVRPQINDTLMGSAIGQSVAPALRESMNELREAMVDAVSTILRAEIDVPDRVARQ